MRGRVSYYVFAVIVQLTVALVSPGSSECRDGFSVKADTFSISNAPGYCFAMAAFSRWYYLNHQTEAPLRKVMHRRAQQRVARELQEFYSKNLIKVQADYCNRYQSNQLESFHRFVTGIMSGEPRIVLLMNKGLRGAVLHAVLAYEWSPEKNLLKVYDPNYNTEERLVDLDKGEYTSLDITYNSICFPEVLHNHELLVKKMEDLYSAHISRRPVYAGGGPVADPQFRKASASRRSLD